MRILGLYIKVSTNDLCWILVSLINQYVCTVWRKAKGCNLLYFSQKIQTKSKNIRRCFTPKHIIRDLLSNLTFFDLFSNLKENYKCNSAPTILYNNQLYNIVGYLYSFLYNN